MKKCFIFLASLFLFTVTLFPQTYSWELRQSGQSLGNPVALRNDNPDVVYYGTVATIYVSYDRGETFTQWGTNISGSTRIKHMIVSTRDSSTMIVAHEGSPDRIVKTTNRGQSWTIVANNLSLSFYGIPVTMDYSAPETLYSMSSDTVIKSMDFGTTWSTIYRSASGANYFDAPCDLEVFPDSNNILLAGDNTRGIMRSTDYGASWNQVFVTSGEIPTIAVDFNRPGVAYATKWSGGGGFLRTTNYGATWELFANSTFAGKSMWGVHVDPKNSNWVITGTYSGQQSFLSTDAGATWRLITIPSSNYSFVIRDTNTIYAAQGSGFFKLRQPVVPVELTSFRAAVNGSNIEIQWETATEHNNRGFEVEVGAQPSALEKTGFVDGFGTTTERQTYSYSFSPETDGKYYIRLKQIDFDGQFEYSKTLEVDFSAEKNFSLNQNYPNPFNPETKINFSIPAEGLVKLNIFNALGEQVSSVVNQQLTAGSHSFTISASDLVSGIYYYRLTYKGVDGKEISSVKSMTVLK